MKASAFVIVLFAMCIAVEACASQPVRVRPRPEKLDRVADTLMVRCQKMLQMQSALQSEMKMLHKCVQAAGKDRLHSIEQRAIAKLADKQKAIILEIDQAIAFLEADGAAVAFPEVFRQVRDDMIDVQHRLERRDLGAKRRGSDKTLLIRLLRWWVRYVLVVVPEAQMLGLILGAAILGIIVSVMEEGEFPGWFSMVLCVLAASIPAGIINLFLPPYLFFVGLAVGAVCAGCAISALTGMGVKRACIAAAIYLGIQTGISLVFFLIFR